MIGSLNERTIRRKKTVTIRKSKFLTKNTNTFLNAIFNFKTLSGLVITNLRQMKNKVFQTHFLSPQSPDDVCSRHFILSKAFQSLAKNLFQAFCNDTKSFLRICCLAIWSENNYMRIDGIAQWIRLCLPSCRPGFESQAHHICFNRLQSNLCFICLRKINKKGPGLAHFKK